MRIPAGPLCCADADKNEAILARGSVAHRHRILRRIDTPLIITGTPDPLSLPSSTAITYVESTLCDLSFVVK